MQQVFRAKWRKIQELEREFKSSRFIVTSELSGCEW